jgi:hypothetical protein
VRQIRAAVRSPARGRLEEGDDTRAPRVSDSGRRHVQVGCTGPKAALASGLAGSSGLAAGLCTRASWAGLSGCGVSQAER